MMQRHVEPELLDELPANDPRALRSRKDLERVNAWMGHSRIMARQLRWATRETERGHSCPQQRVSREPRAESSPARRSEAAADRNVRAPLRIIEIGAGDGK